jgi:hypothetical protein
MGMTGCLKLRQLSGLLDGLADVTGIEKATNPYTIQPLVLNGT